MSLKYTNLCVSANNKNHRTKTISSTQQIVHTFSNKTSAKTRDLSSSHFASILNLYTQKRGQSQNLTAGHGFISRSAVFWST